MNNQNNIPKTFDVRTHRFPQRERDTDIPDGDITRGEELFKRSCQSCHALNMDGPMGPALENIYLERAGSRRGYQLYSNEQISKKFVWTRAKLFDFIKEPEALVPGTTMLYNGPKSSYDIASVIEYLVFLKTKNRENRGQELPNFLDKNSTIDKYKNK